VIKILVAPVKNCESDVHYAIKPLRKKLKIKQIDFPGWGDHPLRFTSANNYVTFSHNLVRIAELRSIVNWTYANIINVSYKWHHGAGRDTSLLLDPTNSIVFRIAVPGKHVWYMINNKIYRRLLWKDVGIINEKKPHAQPLRIRKAQFSEFIVPDTAPEWLNKWILRCEEWLENAAR